MNKDRELKHDLLKAAKNNGMCRMGKGVIRHKDMGEMLERYKEFIVWQIKHDNPPEAVLRKHFAGFSNDWAACEVEATFADQPKVLLTCDAKGVVSYSEGKRGRVFVRHGAALRLTAAKDTMVVVSLYDDCHAYVEAADGAKVYVFLHDNSNLLNSNLNNIIISKR